MGFVNHRTVILALIVTILVLILIQESPHRAGGAAVSRSMSMNGDMGAPGTLGTPGAPGDVSSRSTTAALSAPFKGGGRQDPRNPNIAIFPEAPLVPPVTSPVYSQMPIGRQKIMIADYTGVPREVSGPMKCIEDPTFFIVDRKYSPIKGAVDAISDSITDVTRELAIAMAGLNEDCGPCAKQNKTPESVWKMWYDMPVFIRGLILEKTRTTRDKMNQDMIAKDLSDEQIQAKYGKEIKFMSKLPIDVCCEDTEDNCRAWALNNQCITNSEYMLTTCPKSCGSCKMNTSQIRKLTNIELTRTPPNCATSEGGL